MTPARNVDGITNDLRARLVEIANDIMHHARGHGAWRGPDQVCLDLTIHRDSLTVIIDEMVKHRLVKRP
jgi:hypothetical protein